MRRGHGPVQKRIALLLVTVLIGAACTGPFAPSEVALPGMDTGGGSVRINLGTSLKDNGLFAATLFPVVDTVQLAHYRFSLSQGPEGAPVPEPVQVAVDQSGLPGDSVSFRDLVPGTWTVVVEAVDVHGNPILGGSGQVLVQAGTWSDAHVAMEPLQEGTGSYEVRIEWPAELAVGIVQSRVADGSWEELAVSEADQETSYVVISDSARPAGAFWLAVRFDQQRAYWEDLVYVFNGLATAHTVVLGPEDFSTYTVTESDVVDIIDTVIVGDGETEGSDGFEAIEGEDGAYQYVRNGAGELVFGQLGVSGQVSFTVFLDDNRSGRVELRVDDGAGGFTTVEEYPVPSRTSTQITFDIPSSAFTIWFQGGNRTYRISDFEVTLD